MKSIPHVNGRLATYIAHTVTHLPLAEFILLAKKVASHRCCQRAAPTEANLSATKQQTPVIGTRLVAMVLLLLTLS